MSDARYELPYPGAKEMLMVENTDDIELLRELLECLYSDMDSPKHKRKQ